MTNHRTVSEVSDAVFEMAAAEAAATSTLEATGGADAIGQEPQDRGNDPRRTAGTQSLQETECTTSAVTWTGNQVTPMVGAVSQKTMGRMSEGRAKEASDRLLPAQPSRG